jgi:hypothetical protein
VYRGRKKGIKRENVRKRNRESAARGRKGKNERENYRGRKRI